MVRGTQLAVGSLSFALGDRKRLNSSLLVCRCGRWIRFIRDQCMDRGLACRLNVAWISPAWRCPQLLLSIDQSYKVYLCAPSKHGVTFCWTNWRKDSGMNTKLGLPWSVMGIMAVR